MNEGRGFQGHPRSSPGLLSHTLARQASQLFIDEIEQLVRRPGVSMTNRLEGDRDLRQGRERRVVGRLSGDFGDGRAFRHR